MSDQRPSDDYPEALAEEFGSDDPDRSAWPILAAAIFVLILVGVVAGVWACSPPDRRLNDSTQVQHVVNDAYTARNSLNYQQFRDSYCAAKVNSPEFPTEQQFADENRKARDAQGQLQIPTMDVAVTGDTAKVTVHWNREDTPNDKQTTPLTVVRENNAWKVCTL
ncbi:DUF4878 domain-containing protein [Gordonia sp. PP30]|uniref:Rv0361 family membrane protein n=1 Tax=unclassified Gordonia (in: high G+C Gram-positive bacteria) TaxID=2657482 RepID=UPI001FFE925F|nr:MULTISPECIES: DUF4878 domain-containing protein [unclassified Gordonia (in: high G+C Gram-positive bacteria)]UQE75508.1 DUF4878 domain-containing protein [Gordonia sp. PP30]